jgi:hypothetical protein
MVMWVYYIEKSYICFVDSSICMCVCMCMGVCK